MIGMLNGVVASMDTATVLLDVHGVGFEVRMPTADMNTLHVGQSALIHTITAVSQDAITLYGFTTREDKRMFIQLQKVSGIGPKVALSLLSTLPSPQLTQAIVDADATALSKAPGLGKKGAQKIILELKGSLDLSNELTQTSTRTQPQDVGLQHVLEGLMSLGWSKQDAQDALDTVLTQAGITPPLAEDQIPTVLKLALTALDTGR